MGKPNLSECAATLVEQLFEAPGDPSAWQRFLGALSAEIGDDCVALLLGEIVPGGPTQVVGHGVDLTSVLPEDVRPSGAHPPADVLPVGKAVPIQVNDPALILSKLSKTVLEQRGLAPGPGLYLVLARNPRYVTGGLFLLSRDPTWKPRARHIKLLELLAPYITIAARTGLRMHEERSKASALLRVLTRLQLGVILTDASNRVSFANDSALEMLGLAGVVAPKKELHRRATAALGSLVKRETGGSSQTLSYPHAEDGRPLSILVAPLRWGEASDAEHRRFTAALFISDPHGAGRDTGLALRELYGLSRSEARLAQQLAAGHTLAEAAANLEIQLSTARGMLRAVFDKTGTHRQSSLVRLIVSGPGQLRGGPAGISRPSSSRR